jgi:LysR family transcriptional regulator (chromosome initiation inhibitor)
MSLLSDNLKAFMLVSELGTVHEAASVLGLTQTGITQRIRSLETSLGVTLFLRSRTGMKRTVEGEELYQYCLSVRRLESESLSFLKDEGNRKPIQVSFCGPTSLMRSRVVPALSKFLKGHPKTLLHIDIDDFEDRIKKIKTGQVDFAFIRASAVPNELEGRPLTPDRFVLIAPKIWRDREIHSIIQNERIIDFDPSDDMTFQYLKKFKLSNKVQNERHFVNNIESLVDLIEDGHGYGVLEEHFLESFLSKRKICILNEGKALENRMALCWSPRPIQSKLFKEIISQICEMR